MEIKINIKKKHLYYLTGLVCLLLIGLVVAVTPWSPGMAYHEPLYTDTITAKDGSTVTVEDELTVTGKITAQGDLDVSGNLKLDKKFDAMFVLTSEKDVYSNTQDWDTEDLGIDKGDGFCFLVRTDISAWGALSSTAGTDELVCAVYIDSDGNWFVKAQGAAGDKKNIKCYARCVKFH